MTATTFDSLKFTDVVLAHQQLALVQADQPTLTPTRNMFGGWDYATQWGRTVRTATDDGDVLVFVLAPAAHRVKRQRALTVEPAAGPMISQIRMSHVSPAVIALIVAALIVSEN